MRFDDVTVGGKCYLWGDTVVVVDKIARGTTGVLYGNVIAGPACIVEYENGTVSRVQPRDLIDHDEWLQTERARDATFAVNQRLCERLGERLNDPCSSAEAVRTDRLTRMVWLCLGPEDVEQLLDRLGKPKLRGDERSGGPGESTAQRAARMRRVASRLARGQDEVRAFSSVDGHELPGALAVLVMSATAAQRWASLLDGRDQPSALAELIG